MTSHFPARCCSLPLPLVSLFWLSGTPSHHHTHTFHLYVLIGESKQKERETERQRELSVEDHWRSLTFPMLAATDDSAEVVQHLLSVASLSEDSMKYVIEECGIDTVHRLKTIDVDISWRASGVLNRSDVHALKKVKSWVKENGNLSMKELKTSFTPEICDSYEILPVVDGSLRPQPWAVSQLLKGLQKVSVDDKCAVPIGDEPGRPVRATARAMSGGCKE
jgi:hypothetical protein